MHPVIFPPDATDFTTNGLGALVDATACLVTEERNGEFELTLTYPANGIHFEELKEGILIRAKPNDTDDQQIFRIYSVEKKYNNLVDISAEHISYQLNNYPVVPIYQGEIDANSETPLEPVEFEGDPGEIWGRFAEGDSEYSPIVPVNRAFTFESSFTDDYALTIKKVTNLRALLGGSENSLLQKWQGEYKFNNHRITYSENRGSDNGVTIKFGKNLTDLTQEITTESMYTHVFPFATKTTYNENDEETYEVEIFAPADTRTVAQGIWTNRMIAMTYKDEHNHTRTLESKYGFRRVKLLDLTEKFNSDQGFTEADVRDKCESYISENPEIKRPKITLTVSFEPKSAIARSPFSEKLERVGLCDTVRVVYPVYGIDEKLKVNKTVYNVLTEKYKKIEIGDPKSNFADTVRGEQN